MHFLVNLYSKDPDPPIKCDGSETLTQPTALQPDFTSLAYFLNDKLKHACFV